MQELWNKVRGREGDKGRGKAYTNKAFMVLRLGAVMVCNTDVSQFQLFVQIFNHYFEMPLVRAKLQGKKLSEELASEFFMCIILFELTFESSLTHMLPGEKRFRFLGKMLKNKNVRRGEEDGGINNGMDRLTMDGDDEPPAGRAQMTHRKYGSRWGAWPYPLPAGGTPRRFMWDPLSFSL